jgi:hypothetical protein
MSTESLNEVLIQFDPAPDSLLREISKHIDDAMLEQIALADYGEEKEEHLAALREIRDTGKTPIKMEWCPTEVLELIRWSQPDDPNWKPGATGLFGHWMRAFCTAALLRALREPTNYDVGDSEKTLINLILSLRALPIDLNPQAASFLSWLLLHSDLESNNEALPAYGVGLLWFALQHPGSTHGYALESLANWIIHRSTQLHPNLILEPGSLPLRLGFGNPPPSAWQCLGEVMFDLDLNSYSLELQGYIQLIAAELAS